VEATPSGDVMRPPGAGGHRLPLPPGVFEVEPDRVPAVQPNQPQLGRPTAEVTRPDARLHPGDEDENGAYGACRTGRGDGPERTGDAQGGDGAAEYHATLGLPRMELHGESQKVRDGTSSTPLCIRLVYRDEVHRFSIWRDLFRGASAKRPEIGESGSRLPLTG